MTAQAQAKSCSTGKLRYEEQPTAAAAAKAVNKRKGGPANVVYRCVECAGFHIGRRWKKVSP